MESWLGVALEIVVTLLGFGAMWGALRTTLTSHGERIDKVEKGLEKLFEITVLFARQEERYAALNTVVTAQGLRLDATHSSLASRIDTQGTLVHGRLEAINNIVSGHTAQLVTIMAKGRNAA